jgi:hypothetical protein
MASNFSTYASRFINQSLLPNASTISNEPLFYSMAEGSHDGELDEDDPHLRRSRAKADEYDPFNLEDIPDDAREDEEEGLEDTIGNAQDSLPLLLQSNWRQPPAGQSRPQRQTRSPSPESSLSLSDDSPPLGLDMLEDDRPAQSTLTQSLIQRTSDSPFVFSLPHPGRTPRRKYNDAGWATFWYTCICTCGVGFIMTLFLTSVRGYLLTLRMIRSQKSLKVPAQRRGPILYSTLTHTIPLMTLFTIFAALLSYLQISLLRVAVKPVLMATSVAVPAIMIVAAAWAFAGSFIWTGKEGGWAETVGYVLNKHSLLVKLAHFLYSLRLFALVPLILAGLSARSLYRRRFLLHEAVSVVTLATKLLLEPGQLPLLALSPAILLAFIIVSLPFFSLAFHLLLIGYFSQTSSGWEWHVQPYAVWLTFGSLFVWFWTWCIARDVLRMCVASIMGAWYFLETRSEPGDEFKAAFYRATGPSLGTNCLSGLVTTGVQGATFAIYHVTKVRL